MLLFGALWLVLCVLVASYIPATQAANVNFATSFSPKATTVRLRWHPSQSYTTDVLRLVSWGGKADHELAQGPLLYISQTSINDTGPPSVAPFIAFVACDPEEHILQVVPNATDLLKLALNKGATAVLLYSSHSAPCVLDPDFATLVPLNHHFSIYSLTSQLSSWRIHDIFRRQTTTILARGVDPLTSFDPRRLNDSHNAIQGYEATSYPDERAGYILATLRPYHTSSTPALRTRARDTIGSSGTSLAMIVLYTITGCVSALFITVIISGAIRAVRHPEQYGARAHGNDNGFGPMTVNRARGLTQAIVDTFPVFKFATTTGANRQPTKDVEFGPVHGDHAVNDVSRSPAVGETDSNGIPFSLNSVGCNLPLKGPNTGEAVGIRQFEGNELNPAGASAADAPTSDGTNPIPSIPQPRDSAMIAQGEDMNSPAGPSSLPVTRNKNPEQLNVDEHAGDDMVPPGIGHDTCPICIVDFEEGDDLRMLPCEGKHVFHQQCVDPWLLELSSSCPICRHDFLALENLISGSMLSLRAESSTSSVEPREHESPGQHGSLEQDHPPSRFSRYLRFALRRRGGNVDDHDPTDPYMPTIDGALL